MSHKHSVLDKDTHFIIDPATRAITTSSEKLHVMQYDHNSETLTFEMPRYVEGHDMSLCNRVEAHFLNIDPKTRDQITGHRVLEDFRVSEEDESKVVVSWTITKGATKIGGLLHFLLNFRCMEGDVETYAWHTDFFKNYTVKGGLDAAALFESEYVDVIEQWKASVMQHFTDDLTAWKAETLENLRKERNKRIYVENETTSEQGVFEGVNYAGQGVTSGLYNFIMHNYTDSPIMRLDNVGSGSIIQAVNAHNSERRTDKEEAYHGEGDLLQYMVQADPNKDGDYTQHMLFKIDKDGMPWWSGWDNAKAGNDLRNKTVKFQTNKLDGGMWAFNFDAVNLNKYLLLLTTGGFQVLQVKTSDDGSCVIESPNGARLTGGEYLNLTSDGNIVIQSASEDLLNAIRFRINGNYYFPQFSNKVCTSTNRPKTAAVGEIYLESDTNRTIRRNAENNGWIDMNGNAV